jgi:osmotically-inducible protein OsmY
MKATELLKKQHREVRQLFRELKKTNAATGRRKTMEEIADQLGMHMKIEEERFYPAVRELGTKKAEKLVPEAYEEHHVVSLVLSELPKVDPNDERFEAKMTVLEELIEHHVEEEEKEMFKMAERLGDEELEELGKQMESAGGQGGRGMSRKATASAAAIAFALIMGVAQAPLAADPATTEEAAQQPADNSGRNVRDRDDRTLTPMDQSENEQDIAITQKIRKQVVDDDSLSMMAHNVKIITANGVVTLRGPVKSQTEKDRIAATAEKVAGANKVQNQLEIAQ